VVDDLGVRVKETTMTLRNLHCGAAVALLVTVTSCSDPAQNPGPDAGPPTGATFHQVEQLARPGINEVLLITEAFNAGFNATAPSFTGVPSDTLNAVVGEAKTVLKALYLGGCLLDGALGLSAAQGVKPAGITCHAVGPALWTEGTLAGVTLTDASKAAAQAYADKVFSQFVPDVMRVDTSVTSNYLTLCGDASSTPLLCGGRFVNNDVIDVTYNYFLNGAATTKGPFDQVRALTSDGVNFSLDDANNVDNVVLPDPANAQQGHPNVTNTFPYSAPPF
jgi:Domain of unknown function (DUF4331)